MDPIALKRRGYSVYAFRTMARRELPRMVFDFVDGGAEREETLRRNEAAFGRHSIWPRPLTGTTKRDQSVQLFNQRLSLPVIIGPTGLAGMLWPRGEVAAARAAVAAGTIYTASHGSAVTMEDLAREAGPFWMQVFMYRDRGLTARFVDRARAVGCSAIVLTIDNQVVGQRERDLRNGFTIPPRFRLGNILDFAWHAPWLMRMAPHRNFTLVNYVGPGEKAPDIVSLSAHMASLLDPAASWEDVEWLRGQWKGPLLLKGILHPAEAEEALKRGVDAIIVSNHGGRQLDGAPASIDALPHIADAVGGRAPILVDGGVRRGVDVVKALALGATACLIGRPQLWGLAVAGEAGVAAVLDVYRREIDRVMALGGWDSISDIDSSALFPHA